MMVYPYGPSDRSVSISSGIRPTISASTWVRACSAECSAACEESRSNPGSVSITGMNATFRLRDDVAVQPPERFLPCLSGGRLVVGIPCIAMESVVGLGIANHLRRHAGLRGRFTQPLDLLS